MYHADSNSIWVIILALCGHLSRFIGDTADSKGAVKPRVVVAKAPASIVFGFMVYSATQYFPALKDAVPALLLTAGYIGGRGIDFTIALATSYVSKKFNVAMGERRLTQRRKRNETLNTTQDRRSYARRSADN